MNERFDGTRVADLVKRNGGNLAHALVPVIEGG